MEISLKQDKKQGHLVAQLGVPAILDLEVLSLSPTLSVQIILKRRLRNDKPEQH